MRLGEEVAELLWKKWKEKNLELFDKKESRNREMRERENPTRQRKISKQAKKKKCS